MACTNILAYNKPSHPHPRMLFYEFIKDKKISDHDIEYIGKLESNGYELSGFHVNKPNYLFDDFGRIYKMEENIFEWQNQIAIRFVKYWKYGNDILYFVISFG
ncbi:hypothetical protein PFY12_14500 [Chryseobacterium camelliae]|uniref:DUF4177 domain-containing protein n=1 Tax=Chryseobacterium camelliae TaxID=1265445 RepID=A0ABY7QKS9_9FLAO|nr:hypothetical protein [Chryseobacterium camelliae]WBV60235.1 hypothetical protein PFY12_14500 [Chryseobacterium camelliae]